MNNSLVVVKRDWCPDWLWDWLCISTEGRLPLIQPLRWILSRELDAGCAAKEKVR